MPALVAGIHVFPSALRKAWMAGTSPDVTVSRYAARPIRPRWVKPKPAAYFSP
jgi:hypothetical protein